LSRNVSAYHGKGPTSPSMSCPGPSLQIVTCPDRRVILLR
jgi:hypothetical protein